MAIMNEHDEEMLPEYDLSKLGKSQRGKYHARFKRGGVYVPIEDDLAQEFPDAQAVNEALREYRLLKRKSA
jgi:hypothetical protein